MIKYIYETSPEQVKIMAEYYEECAREDRRFMRFKSIIIGAYILLITTAALMIY